MEVLPWRSGWTDGSEQRRAITEEPDEPEDADPGEVPFEADVADVLEQQAEVGPGDEEELRA
ncbi:MAG TPA: hypothetical protein VIW24_16060 [Aldersonia sp.]